MGCERCTAGWVKECYNLSRQGVCFSLSALAFVSIGRFQVSWRVRRTQSGKESLSTKLLLHQHRLCEVCNFYFPSHLIIFRILKVPGSNLGPEIGYPGWEFHGFLQSLQANAEKAPEIRPRQLPSISFPIHYSLIIPSSDATVWATDSFFR
jgi:hypothetical protein